MGRIFSFGLAFFLASVLVLSLLLSLAQPLQASIDIWQFQNPEQQQRYYSLTRELRCPKCDGQSIGDSNAPIANDLRGVIYEQLQSGMNDRQIVDFMVDRYGEFVLYRPRMEGKTLWLWLGPILFALIGFGALAAIIIRSRKRSVSVSAPELDEQERERLNRLLAGEHKRGEE